MPKVIIDEERCKGCELCSSVCPRGIVVMEHGRINSRGYCPAIVTDMDECIGCAFCARICPDIAIKVQR